MRTRMAPRRFRREGAIPRPERGAQPKARSLALDILLACSITSACLAGYESATAQRAALSYAAFSSEESRREQGDTDGGEPDWNRLASVNEDVVGWLRLKTLGIDTPVVQQRAGMEDNWYLTHDIWGSPNPAGCPYLDPASSIDGGHILVYGHNGGMGGGAFSPITSNDEARSLAPTCTAELRTPDGRTIDGGHILVYGHNGGMGGGAFSPITSNDEARSLAPTCTAELRTPDGRTRTFLPLMSLNVSAAYDEIRSFPPSGGPEIHELIRILGEDAAIKTRKFDRAAENATEILSLVTCSQSTFATDRRTIMLFYIADAP